MSEKPFFKKESFTKEILYFIYNTMKIEHALSIIYIFKQGEEAKNLFEDVIKKFSLTEHKDDVNYKYKFYSNDNCCLEWLSFNSVIGIHILIEKQDKGFADTWAGYKSSFEQSVGVEYPKSSEFLGASILYWGFLDTEIDKSRGIEIIENELGLKPEQSTELKQGCVLWLIKDYNQKSKVIEYAIFSPKLNLKKREFILKIIHLLMPIELSAHIQRDQIKHYKNHRDELLNFMQKLNTETLNMLKAFNIKSSETQHKELDKLSKQYSSFVGMVSWANNILNTAQIELSNYKELADKISKEEDEIFEKQLRNFEKEIEQVRYDLNYCDSTTKNANTGLELLRVADSARMQKQGLIQQAALTVIEVVFVFYYSLGVWHFIVEESVWEHIAPLGKLGFGFTVATTVPLFAHFLVKKKWKCSFACIVFIVMAVAYAYWVTSSLL